MRGNVSVGESGGPELSHRADHLLLLWVDGELAVFGFVAEGNLARAFFLLLRLGNQAVSVQGIGGGGRTDTDSARNRAGRKTFVLIEALEECAAFQ